MSGVLAAATLTAQYNNLDNVREVFAANKHEIAGIILEPVVGNSGYIAPTKEFLQVALHTESIPTPQKCSASWCIVNA